MDTKFEEDTMTLNEEQAKTSLSYDDNNETLETISSSAANVKTSSKIKKRKLYSKN